MLGSIRRSDSMGKVEMDRIVVLEQAMKDSWEAHTLLKEILELHGTVFEKLERRVKQLEEDAKA